MAACHEARPALGALNLTDPLAVKRLPVAGRQHGHGNRIGRKQDVHRSSVAGRAQDRHRSAKGLDPVFEADHA